MKSIAKYFLIGSTVLLMFGFQGCKKYSEDTGISLRTRTQRISNTWKIDNYKINSTDFTSLATDYVETFSKSGGYTYSWTLLNGSGSWALQNKDKEIKLTGGDSHSSRTLYILKLEDKALWYYFMVGNDRHEFHLVEKAN